MSDSVIYTNDKCIGCNKCIKVCSAIGACVSVEKDGKPRIDVDGNRCVACGSCIDACQHGAREFHDDTERFFADLAKGEEISLLLAPAFRANYPEEYESVLGGLKQMGVRHIISVSFGADITTWGYLNFIREHDFVGGISQPCPALVSYIERYLPSLLDRLFPVQSPLMCAAIYARKEMGIKDKFAFISPCIAKKIEIEDPHNAGLVQYNVTFDHLMRYVREHGISGPSVHSEIEYGLGSFYPTPGGLAENIKWFLGDEVYIRQMEGEKHLYEWLHKNEERIRDRKTPFLVIDALNCKNGCICGTAVNPDKAETDDALYALLDIREKSKKATAGDAWSRPDTPEERLKNYNAQFTHLHLEDYLRGYTDRSESCRYKEPDEKALEEIFLSMNKKDEASRHIDCTCCGYESCRQMAMAIYNGFNRKENCIYYEKAMVQELGFEKAVAEEASKAKSSFLANMSHEIRTPINAVLGMNEMILRECSDEKITEYSENIKSAGKSLLGLINNILDFSKIEAGKIQLEESEYELGSLLFDVVNVIRPVAEEKALELHLDFDESVPGRLRGDEVRIRQVMVNILTNAVKYTNRGSVTFSVHSEPDENVKDTVFLRITVKDTGIGIKPEDMERLFSEFERIEEKRNRNIEGTGLGLNITKSLLELMGSRLEVSSVYGEGSEFSFLVGQQIVSSEPMGNYEEAGRHAAGMNSGSVRRFIAPEARVLVVDDYPLNLTVFQNLLSRTQIRTDCAESGDAGIALTRNQKYDMIFLDHMMPVKDGIETLQEIHADEKNPNRDGIFVCLTANAILGARETYLEAGFDDYLTKPIDSDQLEAMLLHYLPAELIVEAPEEEGNATPNSEELPPELELLKGTAVDVAAGVKNNGDVGTYLTVLRTFYDSIEAQSEELNRCYEEEDFGAYTIKVHALKSAARIVGAAALGEEAQQLENAGKSGDIDYIRSRNDAFLQEYFDLLEVLAPVFATSQDAEDKTPIDAEMLLEVYHEIRRAAEGMDIDQMDTLFEDMEEYAVPPEEQDLWNTVLTAYRNFDYMAIVEVLEGK